MKVNTLKITAIPEKIFGKYCSVRHKSRKAGTFDLFCDISQVEDDIKKYLGRKLLLEGFVAEKNLFDESMTVLIVEKVQLAGDEEVNTMEVTAKIEALDDNSGHHTFIGSHYGSDSRLFQMLLYSPDFDLEPERYVLCKGYLSEKKNLLRNKSCQQMVVETCDHIEYETSPEVTMGMEVLGIDGVFPYDTLNDALEDKHGKFDDLQKDKLRQLINVTETFRSEQRNNLFFTDSGINHD